MHSDYHRRTLIMSFQSPFGIPPVVRGQVDYLCLFRNSLISARKKIYDQWLTPYFSSFEVFCQYMDMYTNGGIGGLIIHLSSESTVLNDCVFSYVWEDHPPIYTSEEDDM